MGLQFQVSQCTRLLDTDNISAFECSYSLLGSVEKKFRKENMQFSSRSFFPFPGTAHDEQTYAGAYCRTVSALKNTYVWASSRSGSQRWWVRIPLSAIFLTFF